MEELELLKQENEKLKDQVNRFRDQIHCLESWVNVLQQGVSVREFLEQHQAKEIAIYGAGVLGKLFLAELEESDVEVKYFIDQSADKSRCRYEKKVILPDEYGDAEAVDMVVVTAISAFENVCTRLVKARPEIPVVSVKKIVDVLNKECWYEKQ